MSIHRLHSFSSDPYSSLASLRTTGTQRSGSVDSLQAPAPTSSAAFSNHLDQATPPQPRLMQMVMSSLAVSMGQTSPPTTTALTQNAAPSATQAPLGLSENSSAVSDALATSPPANPVQALSSFMRSLMTALQTQTHSQAQAQSQSLSLSPTPSPSSTPHQGIAPHPGLQRLDSTSQIGTALQSLVTQLKTGPNPLQQSYSGLVSSLGGDPHSASLNQFLSHFEQQLQTMGPTGNLVNLTA